MVDVPVSNKPFLEGLSKQSWPNISIPIISTA